MADSCSARKEHAVNDITARGYALEVSIQRGWADAYGFVDYSLKAGVRRGFLLPCVLPPIFG